MADLVRKGVEGFSDRGVGLVQNQRAPVVNGLCNFHTTSRHVHDRARATQCGDVVRGQTGQIARSIQHEQHPVVGAGTDVAVETGDAVLMKSDPADVLAAMKISRARCAR
jgi:hypothetical protein